ncbi:diguanylate cyclase domain-containing protein [Acaryochloris sp. CCMEE 5410]|uniref:diguanylate cyclase domain-containing protein n=1 Tax=Acaryochloris sp. CCMEE 5410 TaxID=310037 RepID=UPI0002484799|nr:diguanylate cyclase [Acaryochloris sp. CCMEE 5410]KAI9130638.1 diguanylate cyclase [Acaryochloris sp. CCMEE 5410]
MSVIQQFWNQLTIVPRQLSLGLKTLLDQLESPTLALPEVAQSQATGNHFLLAYQKLADLDSQYLSLSERLQKSVEILSETLGFAIVVLDFYDPNQQTLQFQAGTIRRLNHEDEGTLQRLNHQASQVLGASRPLVLVDDQGVINQTHLASYLPPSALLKTVVQLPVATNHTVLGMLTLGSPELLPDADMLCLWGKQVASFLAWLIQAERSNTCFNTVQERFALVASSFRGCFYDWDIASASILQFTKTTEEQAAKPHAPRQFSVLEWLDQIHPEDRHLLETLIDQDFQGEDQFELEYRWQSDGQPFMCDRGVIQRDAQGVPNRVVGVLTNIAGFKRLEVNAQQQIDHYQTLLADISIVIFKTDLAGHWTYLNPAWSKLTGVSLEDSLGKPIWDFVHPDDRPGLQEAFHNLVEQTAESYGHELRFFSQQGGCAWVVVHNHVMRAEDGTRIGTAGTLEDASERKQTEQALLHDALHDGLTQLPNRVLFMDRLEQACRSFQRHPEEIFAVLFLDLDRFKIINDTLGHMVGDQLLVAVAHRLQTCLRPEDTVARLGGDEFTLLLPNIDQAEDAMHISDRILQSLKEPFTLDHTEVFITVSIGIAMSGNPEHKPDDLLRHADIALYRAKANGKGCYAVFSPEMPLQPLAQVQVETEVRQALDDEEFRLYCQPVHSLENNEVWGFTLQMYWQHPQKGMLPSFEFLPSVTDTGLQRSLGWWVLRKACAQLHQWQRMPTEQPLSIWVVVSEAQLTSSNFLSKFERLLEKHDINPQHLVLELPPSLWPRPSKKVLAHLQDVHSRGVQLARVQDNQDFDWLSGEESLPVDWVKLSSTLLGNLDQQGYLESIHSLFILAASAEIKMLADGIQTPKQRLLMSALKCDYGQGHNFTDPIPAHAADPWLEPSYSQPLDSMNPSSSMSLLIIYSPIGQSQVPLVGKQSWTIGRSPDNTIVLPDRWASRNHAQLRATDAGEFFLIDLGSGNGSVVNGERVTMPVALKDGDLITIGHSQLEFHHRPRESALSAIETAPKNVLMMQASHMQGQVWKEALSSQGISLTWLNENIDLAQYLTQSIKSGQGVPDLLLLDMTILKPNPYSFCRWCHNLHPTLKIILTSGTRTFVPASERKWATHQGASELIAAFDEGSIFSNLIDVMAKVRVVLATINWRPIEQGSLSSALLAIKPSLTTSTFNSRQTIIGELPADLEST